LGAAACWSLERAVIGGGCGCLSWANTLFEVNASGMAAQKQKGLNMNSV